IEHHGVDPSRILTVTFTNKAAGEMRERIGRLLGEEPRGMWSGTFHSIGARMLRRHAPMVGRTANYTIYDETDTLGVIKRIMERQRISPKEVTPKAISNKISDAKNSLSTPEELASSAFDPITRAAAAVYQDLEPEMRSGNAVSFDDLLVLPVRIFRDHPEIRDRYSEQFRFVLVDEYQDTNRAQYQFIRALAQSHSNVMVVGDDDQSIYGWRGADIRNILDFERHFPAARIVRLEENYRSTPNILAVANAAISANVGRKGKTLRATLPGGEQVTEVATLDERDEAEWVVDEIKARQSREGIALSDAAVLYRTNSQSRALEDSFRRHAIPYRLVGSVRFYDRREIRDLVSYLKLIANPWDDEAFRRAVSVPKRGLGETSVDTLAETARRAELPMLEAARRADLVDVLRPAARKTLAEFADMIERLRAMAVESSVDELLRELIDAIQYGAYLQTEGPESARERGDNVNALISGAAELVVDEGGEVGLTPLDHFLQHAMLIAGVDVLDSSADAVTLMTLHNAKGLEFPMVVVAGLEDGLFPLGQSIDEPAMLEEERRLFYVGVTRAEKKLYLTHAETRFRNGQTMPSMRSRFLKEIPAGMLEERKTIKLRSMGRRSMFVESPSRATWGERAMRRNHGAPEWRKPARDPDIDASQDEAQYVRGERIKHKLFGGGTIAELTGAGRDVKAIIDFDDESVGRKTIKLAYTTLERGLG
ncbi:MAG TPA: UvrD-helicase domain-containing protein, partial [Gemmatimonadaceae bacterium]|nr:UvrD-helicase domain-containing protein [Gemmatimonadaceae bacterium]